MRRLVLKTKWMPYIGMSILILPFALLFLILGLLRANFELIKPATGLCVGLLLWYVYLGSFKVVVTNDILCVRNFYIWHRIQLSEIARAYIQTSMKTWLGERMTFRIWVEPRKGSKYKGFFIPIVNYKPEQLKELYEILGIKSKRMRLFSREKI